MEVATAAITLLTFLKDIIALARELKRTVNKIPQNRQNARKLSDEVLEGLLDIENFYKARGRALEGSPELREALEKLLKQIQDVHATCVKLFTPSGQKGWRKIGAALKAWRDCDQVEREITELKNHVHGCYRRFTLMAVARLEEPVNQINIATTRMEGTLLNMNENQTVMLDHMEGFLTRLQGPNPADTSSSAFIQPSIDAVNTLYLHHQVETISNSLSEISASRTFAIEWPNDRHLRFKPMIASHTIGPTPEDNHREVVAKTLEIIRLLKDDSADLSVRGGAWEMVNLSLRLFDLEMYADADAMGSWTVTMCRALVGVNPTFYRPYLALSLRNLSMYKIQNNDYEGAMAVILESLDIQRKQVEEDPALEARSQLVTTLNEYWSITSKGGDPDKCMQIATEAVTIIDSVRAGIAMWETWLTSTQPQQFLEPDLAEIEGARRSASPLSTVGWDEEETMWLEYNTARALFCLAYSLHDQKRLDEAYETQLRSMAKYQLLTQKTTMFKVELAGCYAHLASPPMREGHNNDQSLIYAERAVEIFRELSLLQPVRYTPCLLDSLWDYASLLHEAGRTDEVIRVTEEALILVRKSKKTQRLLADALHSSSSKLRNLERADTAVILRTEAIGIYRNIINPALLSTESVDSVDPVVVPNALMDLANDFLVAGKADKAVEACKEAINIYQEQLEQARGSDESSANLGLARGLSYLCYCTTTANDYDTATKIGKKAISIYRNQYQALGADFHQVANYLQALDHTSVSASLASEAHAHSTTTEVVQDLEMLNLEHSEAVGGRLLNALYHQESIYTKHRRVRESIAVNERILKLIGPLPITDVAMASDYIAAMDIYAGNLFDIGRPKDALQSVERATDLGRSFPEDVSKELACALAAAETTQAACLHAFGRHAEAEDIIKCSIDRSHKYLPPEDDTLLACRYRCYSHILRNVPGRLEEALETGQKAVAICRGSITSTVFTDVHLPYTLHSYAACVAESGDVSQALYLIQESIKLYRNIRAGNDPFVPWTRVEPFYAVALLDLGSCLMADRNYEDAYDALTECEMICHDVMTALPARFIEYVVCLDLLAINRGALGLDDEEKHFSEELDSRQKAIEVFNPQLAIIARIVLEQLRNSPFQVRLRQFLKDNRVGQS